MKPIVGLTLFTLAVADFALAAESTDEPTQTATAQQPANPALSDQVRKWCQPIEGIQFQFNYTGEVLGNVSGGYKQGAIYEGLLKTGVQFDLEKLCGWKGGTLFANVLYPHGDGLTQRYVHDLNVVSNIDAYDSVRLNELWFEQKLGDKFSARFGELAADAEFFVCDSGALFLNSSFGVLPVISLNLDAPVYPMTAPALRLEWNPDESFLLHAGVYGGDLGNQGRDNKHGGRIAFNSDDGALILAEAVYKTNVGGQEKGLQGIFKLGGFCDTGKLADVGDSNTTHRGDYGMYVIADQALYREHSCPGCCKDCKLSDDQGLNCFTRIGFAIPDDRNLVSAYLEGGLTCKGLIPGRDKDTCGLACSYTHISDDVLGASGGGAQSHHETVIEATYQAALGDWLSFQPDFQYVINPGATGEASNAIVVGARFIVNF